MATVSHLTTYNIGGTGSSTPRNAFRSPRDRVSILLFRVAEGDQAAMADLYDETSAILFGLLTHMLGHGTAAEEALVEVYARVWRRAASYRSGGSNPLAWLFSTARECVLSNNHSDAAIDLPLETSGVPEAAVVGVGGTEQPTSNDEAVRAREALRGLDRKQGEALRMCYFSGLGSVERTFNLSTDEARSLVRDALESLVRISRRQRVGG